MGKSKYHHIQNLASALERLNTNPTAPNAVYSSSTASTPALDSAITTRTPSISAPTPKDYDDEERADSVTDIDDPSWYMLTQTPDRGLSLTAARRIPAGTLIFSETPLIRIPLSAENDRCAIESAFTSLRKSLLKQYLKLFNAKKSSMSEVVGIYNSNCYDIKAFHSEGGSCIGVISSRINHSCLPNVNFCFQDGEMQFRAIKTISKGKELASNYEKSIFDPAQMRRDRLQRGYSFECTCEACEPKSEFWKRSDERRRGMKERVKLGARCEAEWSKLGDADGKRGRICVEAIETLLDLEGLLIKEGLSYTPQANCYRSLAKWAARSDGGGNGESVKWLERELEVVVRCFGEQSQRARAIREEIDRVRALLISEVKP